MVSSTCAAVASSCLAQVEETMSKLILRDLTDFRRTSLEQTQIHTTLSALKLAPSPVCDRRSATADLLALVKDVSLQTDEPMAMHIHSVDQAGVRDLRLTPEAAQD